MRLIVRYSQPGLLGREFPSLSLSGIAFAYTLCVDVNLRVDTRIYGVAGEIGLVYTRQDGVYEMSDTGLLQGCCPCTIVSAAETILAARLVA